MSSPSQKEQAQSGRMTETCLGELLSQVTRSAALAAASCVGRGDEMAADLAAAQAMKSALAKIDMRGLVTVRERDPGSDSTIVLGETVGTGRGAEYDLALDPLEGSTLAAKGQPNALSAIAAGPRGGFLAAPDIYMEKLAIGPGHEASVIDLDAPAGENAERLARAKGRAVSEITVCVLDRPRHERIIADLRRVGARVRLISDGDVLAVIKTAMPESGIDMYVGQGGAPEGVLAAAALKCLGGQMYVRLAVRNDADRRVAAEAGLDPRRVFALGEIVRGDTVFAATGVTHGSLLSGVSRKGGRVLTHSLVMSSQDGVIRHIHCSAPERADAS